MYRAPCCSRLLRAIAAAALLAASACSSSSGSDSGGTTTLVTVSPASFAGNVTCAAVPGGWRTYVASLIDVTDPASPFRLASSGPTPCNLPVSFAFVVPGHYYIAEIQGYDRADLVPFGGASSGSPHMTDPATGLDVSPRWTTSCGSIPDPSSDPDAGGADPNADAGLSDAAAYAATTTVCWQSTNVLVQHCAPLHDAQPSDEASLTIRGAPLRGAIACGAEAGQLSRLRILPADPQLSERAAECDEDVTFTGLVPGTTYQFQVEGFQKAGGAATWATSCRATAKAGLDLPVQCEPLTTKGGISVDIAALLAQAGRVCSENDIASYQAVLLGTTQPATELSCTANTTYSSLSPATYQLVVDTFDSAHAAVFTAFCEGAVKPGTTVDATCEIALAP